MTFEPGSAWRLTATKRLIRVDSCARSGRVLAHYINEDGTRAKPEFRNVVSFSIDFLESFAKLCRQIPLTSGRTPRQNGAPADDRSATREPFGP